MIDGYRIVVVIPAGRKACMEILMTHLCRFRGEVDEIQVWENTPPSQVADRDWVRGLPALHGPGWVRLIEDGQSFEDNHPAIARFWVNCQESKTIYFRFDDDVVYIHPGYFQAMVAYRLAHREPFLVFPQIWHNGLCNHINQGRKLLSPDYGITGAYVYDNEATVINSIFAQHVHRVLISKVNSGQADSLLWPHDPHLGLGQMISINAFCFFGEDFAQIGGIVQPDEEHDLARDIPIRLGRSNAIYGKALVAHFAFGTQWQRLLPTGLLEQYKRIAEKMLAP